MSNQSDRLKDYPLFYEDLNRIQPQRPIPADDSSRDRSGLSEDQIAKLGEDLRKPIRDQSNSSSPIQ